MSAPITTYSGLGGDAEPQRCLFVKGLAKGVHERHLATYYSSFGPLQHCQLARHRSGRSAGFAIVAFCSHAEACAALLQTDGATFLGRKLAVRWFQPDRDGPGLDAGGFFLPADVLALQAALAAADAAGEPQLAAAGSTRAARGMSRVGRMAFSDPGTPCEEGVASPVAWSASAAPYCGIGQQPGAAGPIYAPASGRYTRPNGRLPSVAYVPDENDMHLLPLLLLESPRHGGSSAGRSSLDGDAPPLALDASWASVSPDSDDHPFLDHTAEFSSRSRLSNIWGVTSSAGGSPDHQRPLPAQRSSSESGCSADDVTFFIAKPAADQYSASKAAWPGKGPAAAGTKWGNQLADAAPPPASHLRGAAYPAQDQSRPQSRAYVQPPAPFVASQRPPLPRPARHAAPAHQQQHGNFVARSYTAPAGASRTVTTVPGRASSPAGGAPYAAQQQQQDMESQFAMASALQAATANLAPGAASSWALDPLGAAAQQQYAVAQFFAAQQQMAAAAAMLGAGPGGCPDWLPDALTLAAAGYPPMGMTNFSALLNGGQMY